MRAQIMILAAVASLATISDARADHMTGNVLSDMCTKRELVASYYVLGAVDAFNVNLGVRKRYCIPGGTDVTGNQLTNAACQYIAEHPTEQHLDAGILIFRSLVHAFPCRGR